MEAQERVLGRRYDHGGRLRRREAPELKWRAEIRRVKAEAFEDIAAPAVGGEASPLAGAFAPAFSMIGRRLADQVLARVVVSWRDGEYEESFDVVAHRRRLTGMGAAPASPVPEPGTGWDLVVAEEQGELSERFVGERGFKMRRGFTLLEVIIATAVVGLIGVSIYGAVDRSFGSKEEVAEYSERYRQAYVALDRMARGSKLGPAFVSNHVEQGEPQVETLFMGEDDEIRTAFSNTVLRRRPSRRPRPSPTDWMRTRRLSRRTENA